MRGIPSTSARYMSSFPQNPRFRHISWEFLHKYKAEGLSTFLLLFFSRFLRYLHNCGRFISMAYISPHDGSSDSSQGRKNYNEYQERKNYNEYQQEVNIADNVEEDNHHHLHRGLKARQITMIAIGGAIGTGLIIGT